MLRIIKEYIFVTVALLSSISFPLFSFSVGSPDRYIFNKFGIILLFLLLLTQVKFRKKKNIIYLLFGTSLIIPASVLFKLTTLNYGLPIKSYYDSWLLGNVLCTISWFIVLMLINENYFKLFLKWLAITAIFSSAIVYGYQYSLGLNTRAWSFYAPASVATLPVLSALIYLKSSFSHGYVSIAFTGSTKAAFMVVILNLYHGLLQRKYLLIVSLFLLSPMLIYIFTTYVRDLNSMVESAVIRFDQVNFDSEHLFTWNFQVYGLTRGIRDMSMDPHNLYIYIWHSISPLIALVLFLTGLLTISIKPRNSNFILMFFAFMFETFIFKEPCVSGIIMACALRSGLRE